MNCITVISTTDFDSSKQSELINYYSSYLQVDGIIVFGLQSTLKKGYDTPFINLGYSSIENVDCVHSELYPAVLDAVKYLKDNGHSKIACISEKLTSGKLDLIRRACTENGLQINPDDIVVCTERFENAGKLGIQKLLKENTQATAIFCTYDYIALGAIKQLFDNGYSVPEDFSVIGMDNINEAKYLNKSLTTIDSHIDRQCQIICNLMKKKLENRFFQLERSVILNSDLIIRDTVCRNKDCYK